MEGVGRRWHPGWGTAAGVATLLVLSGVLMVLDLDRDGDSTWRELRQGTRPWDGDTDGDGLEDGWETRGGLNPLSRDSDDDGVPDDVEIHIGSNPLSGDSDGDGLSDLEEQLLPDCDGDGLAAIVEGDGDDDGRLDALEAPGDRCTRDSDGDGVPDGSEGNDLCVHLVDCDGDGLADGDETGGFDALNPDSFGAGLSDGILFAFQESGQPPGADADRDGIPDGWEGDDGLIVWGDLRPQPGQRDLLVEFVRVQGPDSGQARYATASFAPAYSAVADMLWAERGLRMRWVETVVTVAQESDPELRPRLEDPHYAEVLTQARHSGNPYVTTVVLNPQHDQSQVLHAGVTTIRGMLAAVDYGTHMQVTFSSADGDQVLRIQPLVESLVRGGRQDLLADLGFRGGYTAAGEMGLESVATGNQILWTPSWFRGAPRLVSETDVVQLQFTGVTVFHGSLASTILHELGHTLGLCHAHDADCNAAFTPADRARQAESTMSYDAPGNLLHFLDSEWSTVLQYVACPPDAPIAILAAGGQAQEVLQTKYGYTNNETAVNGSRACNDFAPLPRQFMAGDPPAMTYRAPARHQNPDDDPAGPGLFLLGVALALGATAAATVLTGRWRARTRGGASGGSSGSNDP